MIDAASTNGIAVGGKSVRVHAIGDGEQLDLGGVGDGALASRSDAEA
jgi:hypothetical protein